MKDVWVFRWTQNQQQYCFQAYMRMQPKELFDRPHKVLLSAFIYFLLYNSTLA